MTLAGNSLSRKEFAPAVGRFRDPEVVKERLFAAPRHGMARDTTPLTSRSRLYEPNPMEASEMGQGTKRK